MDLLNLAIDRDGRRIVTGPNFAGAGGCVGIGPDAGCCPRSGQAEGPWLWDADTGEPIKALEGHTDSIVYNGISPDESRLITVSSDGTARIWRLETGALEGVLDLVDAFGERDVDLASSAAFDAGGGRVLTWTKSGATFWRLIPSAGGSSMPSALPCPLPDGGGAPRVLLVSHGAALVLRAKKWPYHDPAATRRRHTLDERVLLVWEAWRGCSVGGRIRTFDWMRDQGRRVFLCAPSSRPHSQGLARFVPPPQGSSHRRKNYHLDGHAYPVQRSRLYGGIRVLLPSRQCASRRSLGELMSSSEAAAHSQRSAWSRVSRPCSRARWTRRPWLRCRCGYALLSGLRSSPASQVLPVATATALPALFCPVGLRIVFSAVKAWPCLQLVCLARK
jgi:hypothetical protein